MTLHQFLNLTLSCAILVWAPLLLAQMDRRFHPQNTSVHWIIRLASLLAIVSLFLTAGTVASVATALPWFIVSMFVGALGLQRIWRWGLFNSANSLIGWCSILLAGGGTWFLSTRLSIPFLGFYEPWKTLTAIHFHFAGFCLPVAYVLVAAQLENQKPAIAGTLRRFILLYLLGFIFVAGGINGWAYFEKIGSVTMALSGIGMIGIVLAQRTHFMRGRLSELLLALSSVAGATALSLGVMYAWRLGPFVDFQSMASTHGILNAFLWVPSMVFVVVLNRLFCRDHRDGIPWSRLSAGRKVGPQFFADLSIPGQVEGLVERFDVMNRADFDSQSVSPEVRNFYERTTKYKLHVTAEPAPAFALGWRMFVGPFFSKVEQLVLPSADKEIEGSLCLIDPAKDGRASPRGWTRVDMKDRSAVYVAAYALHQNADATYMNIAFPLPWGNMTSVLLPVPSSIHNGGLLLTTLTKHRVFGDQGVFWVSGGNGLRLPLNENIEVWYDGQLKARHQMWLFGWAYLTLDYRIEACS